MKTIYESNLLTHLKQLYLVSATAIPWADLYMWFGTQKISKNVYRHIFKAWNEVCEDHQDVWPARTKAPKLKVLESGFNGLVIQREAFSDEGQTDFNDFL